MPFKLRLLGFFLVLPVFLGSFALANGEPDPKSNYVINAGIVKIVDSVKVPAELSGVIADLNYREGDMVHMGQPLGKINNKELLLRLKRSQIENRISSSTAENNIDIRYAQKSLEVSTSRVSRSRKSNIKVPGAVPLSRIQQQELEMHRDTLRVEQATKDQAIAAMQVELTSMDVELTQLAYDRSTVLSPLDGMIVSVEARAGEWVQPGDTILKIVRMNRLKIEGFVPVHIASQMKIGDGATATFEQPWLKGMEFPGQVVFINPEANPVNSTVQVWVEIDNSELKLIPGLNAQLTVEFTPK